MDSRGEGLGAYIGQLRTAKRMTSAALALRMGVRRATVSNWQTGKSRPRYHDLNLLLDVLTVTYSERRQALLLYHAPFPVHVPESILAGGQRDGAQMAVYAPHGGDLLRALRLRRSWSQERLATAVGVDQSQIVRWERGIHWPDATKLHSMCLALHAHPQELIGLTTGQFATGEREELILDHDAVEMAFLEVMSWPITPQKAALIDLMYLDMAGKAWRSTLHHPECMLLVVDIYSVYAERLYQQFRYQEAIAMATRALKLALHIPNCPTWPRALVRLAEAHAANGGTAGAKHGVALLRDRLSEIRAIENPLFTAWTLSTMARLVSAMGQQEGLDLGQEANHLVEESEWVEEVKYRRLDYVETLLNLGKPEQARDMVEPLDANPVLSCIYRAESYRQMANGDEAFQWLTRARQNLELAATFDAHLVPYYTARIEQVATPLGRN